MIFSKEQITKYSILAIIIIIGLSIIGWNFWNINKTIEQGVGGAPVAVPSKVTGDGQLKADITVRLAEDFKKYGDWPITDVVLSEERGNPFIKK